MTPSVRMDHLTTGMDGEAIALPEALSSFFLCVCVRTMESLYPAIAATVKKQKTNKMA